MRQPVGGKGETGESPIGLSSFVVICHHFAVFAFNIRELTRLHRGRVFPFVTPAQAGVQDRPTARTAAFAARAHDPIHPVKEQKRNYSPDNHILQGFNSLFATPLLPRKPGSPLGVTGLGSRSSGNSAKIGNI